MDADDYRFLIALDALERLDAVVKNWGLPWPLNRAAAIEELRRARASLLRARYSFLPARMLIETNDYAMLEEAASRLKEMLLPKKAVQGLLPRQLYKLAEIRYSLWILLGLRYRLLLGEDNKPEHAVDVIGAEVTSVEKHPELERLRVTRASTGTAVFTVLTNIEDIRVGEVRAIALLPPAMFGKIVSEAMYASDPLPDKYKGKRVPGTLISGEAKAKIIETAGRRR